METLWRLGEEKVKRWNILFFILIPGMFTKAGSTAGISGKSINFNGRVIISVGETGCDETTIQGAFLNHNLEPGDIIEIRGSRTYSEDIELNPNNIRKGGSDHPVIMWPDQD